MVVALEVAVSGLPRSTGTVESSVAQSILKSLAAHFAGPTDGFLRSTPALGTGQEQFTSSHRLGHWQRLAGCAERTSVL